MASLMSPLSGRENTASTEANNAGQEGSHALSGDWRDDFSGSGERKEWASSWLIQNMASEAVAPELYTE